MPKLFEIHGIPGDPNSLTIRTADGATTIATMARCDVRENTARAISVDGTIRRVTTGPSSGEILFDIFDGNRFHAAVFEGPLPEREPAYDPRVPLKINEEEFFKDSPKPKPEPAQTQPRPRVNIRGK